MEALVGALAAAEAIDDESYRREALSAVAQALAQVGETQQVLAAAEAIRDEEHRAEALRAVAQALGRIGEPDRALGAFRAAFVAERLVGRQNVLGLLREAAPSLARIGDQTLWRACQEIVAVEEWWGA